jgi:hypothetical protein
MLVSVRAADYPTAWFARDCQESCVRGRFSHHALTNLSSNMMANWVLASHHSRGGIFNVCAKESRPTGLRNLQDNDRPNRQIRQT